MRFTLCLLLIAGCQAPDGLTEDDLDEVDDDGQEIVNGIATAAYPQAVELILRPGSYGGEDILSDTQICSGALIGSYTILTAAHCFFAGGERIPDSALYVFSPNAGRLDIAAVTLGDGYRNDSNAGDVAVIRLRSSVSGIAPANINGIASPNFNSIATAVGFGLSGDGKINSGIKRSGQLRTADCDVIRGKFETELAELQNVPARVVNLVKTITNQNLICWDYDATVGRPGIDSTVCSGDSGGPVFATVNDQRVIAGVGAFGDLRCAPGMGKATATNIFTVRDFIKRVAGNNLGKSAPGLRLIGNGGRAVSRTRKFNNRVITSTFEVPEGTTLVRFALSGNESAVTPTGTVPVQLQLSVQHEGVPTETSFACRSVNQNSVFEFCEINFPAAGRWYARVVGNTAAPISVQLTTSTF